jgi:hypothetical protein
MLTQRGGLMTSSGNRVNTETREIHVGELFSFVLKGKGPGSLRQFRKSLMLDLANLRDDGEQWFWKQQGGKREILFRSLPWYEFQKVRDQLRCLWGAATPTHEKNEILYQWLQERSPIRQMIQFKEERLGQLWESEVLQRKSALLPVLEWGEIVPNPANLHAQLAFAVLEHAGKMALCQNPECPAGYFLAKRKTQKYCERGGCTAYAQQTYALKYWNETGAKRRRMRRGKAESAQLQQTKKEKDGERWSTSAGRCIGTSSTFQPRQRTGRKRPSR